jgi:uncharacterized membrane protein YeaQ/YmgE (transglycosylase-associated protein family)
MVRRGFVLSSVAVILLMVSGCGTTPQDRLAAMQSVLSTAQVQAGNVQNVISQFEAASADAKKILSDPNLPAATREQVTGYITQVDQQLAKYRPVLSGLQTAITKLQAQIAVAQASGENLDLGTEIQRYGQTIGLGGAALPAPFNAYAALAGLVTTVVGGVVGSVIRSKKDQTVLAQQKQQADTVVQAIVGSVNELLASNVVTDAEAAKKVLKDYQVANCPEARAAVRQAQGTIA